MKENLNTPIDPEQYWPEAKEMLDKHFAAKSARKRRGLWLFVLAGLISLFVWQSEKGNLTQNPTPNVEQEIVNTEIEKSSIGKENKNLSVLPSEKKMKQTQDNINANEQEVATANNTSSEIANRQKETENKSNKISNSNASSNLSIEITTMNPKVVQQKKSRKIKSTFPFVPDAPLTLATPTPSSEEIQSNNTEKNIKENTSGNSLGFESIYSDENMHLDLLPMLTFKSDPYQEMIIKNDDRPTLYNKKKQKWDVVAYGGVNTVTKDLSGNSSSSYIQRREKEEVPALLPFGGLQLSKSIRNWDFRAGFEFSVIGEQVKYSPYTNGEYLATSQSWQAYNYTVTDTDSTYIWGMLFLNTTDYTVNDSNLTTNTDTLNGVHYNSNLRNANGINRWYVLEMPIEVLYQQRIKRWGIGLSAGFAPGLVVKSSGYYLKEDESNYASIKKFNQQQFTLNVRAGLELSYLINSNCRILLRPSTNYFLTKMQAGENDKQRYRRHGISLGLMYMIP